MEIPSKFDSRQVESKWYAFWQENEYFKSVPDDREPYTIVIPPPNVTGVLHMGHMLNNSLQDIIIRRARMRGFNACWVPGTDHASIATEAKVVEKLKEEGIEKSSLSREAFLEHAWDWTHEYGGVILEQLKKLGCSCDWDRTKFTLDPEMSESVLRVFIDLHNKGLIYRGFRMVNWDPEAQTTLSDEEVIYEEKSGNLYHIAYQVEGSNERVIIATTRPETLLGDTAVCINPEDERFHGLKGKRLIVPIANRSIPIIEDEYVAMDFGTGCLKVTPAHDLNDKALGEKHNLDVIDIFNADATLNKHGLEFEGLDRFVARKKIVKALDKLGVLVKTEPHVHKVGTSERTKAVIEPRLSDQWFLKMEQLAQPAIEAVLHSDEIALLPEKFKNTYRHWMENIRDWNISRQLWWGQRIPAYYYGSGKDDFVVALTPEEALDAAQKKSGNSSLTKADLQQDEDVLDTWFSSWLWPISVFDGIRNPENEEVNYYYPTQDLVTGPDILFFWVARMIIAGYEYTGKKPFKNVYLTGLVRDKQRRKMSKSLGNSPDALKLIETYSADGVRVGLLLSAAAGNDLMFDTALCQQGKGFSNKIWNAFKLTQSWDIDATISQPESSKIAVEWYESRLQQTLVEIEDHYSKYRISDALMASYKLVWDDFCGWLLEIVKPAYQAPIDKQTYDSVIAIFEDNLRILHPFMPFLTEELWHTIASRTPQEALIVNHWPKTTPIQTALLTDFEFASEVISGIRTIRKEKNIAFKDAISLSVINTEKINSQFDVVIKKLGNISEITQVSNALEGALTFRVKSNQYFIPILGTIDIAQEIQKLKEELKYTQGFLKSVQGKLKNEKFVSGAPQKVVDNERKKEADALAKITTIESSLKNLS